MVIQRGGLAVSVSDCRDCASRVRFPGRSAVGFYYKKFRMVARIMEDGSVTRPCLEENVMPSVPVIMNIYGIRFNLGN